MTVKAINSLTTLQEDWFNIFKIYYLKCFHNTIKSSNLVRFLKL